MTKLSNQGRIGKLISNHMTMINELMIMIKITFIMKVMITKNKYTTNKGKNTTTNICDNKNDNKVHHHLFL